MTSARDRVVNGFVKLTYRVHHADLGSRLVTGYAFETPGWPEFHACVRFDRRDTWSSKRWIMDHFESGLALSGAGALKSRSEAPMAVAKLLERQGRDKVLKALSPYLDLPRPQPT